MREIEFHDEDVIDTFKRSNSGEKIDENVVWTRDTCTIAAGPTNAYGFT